MSCTCPCHRGESVICNCGGGFECDWKKSMKFVLISDTHEQHHKLGPLPDGDILIHAGDFTMSGVGRSKGAFYDWLASQPHRHKILIAGNHDFGAGIDPQSKRFHYLHDSGVVCDGVKVWGSPYTPRFGGWAFMEDRGPAIRVHWDRIPADTDILVTHGPPMGILDKPFPTLESCGCEELRAVLPRLTALKLHVFGHIHGGAGVWWDTERKGSPIFANASVVDEQYKVVRQPLVLGFTIWQPKTEIATP